MYSQALSNPTPTLDLKATVAVEGLPSEQAALPILQFQASDLRLCAAGRTEAASVRSLLRALAAPSSRARAASLAGTSTASSPAPTSCCATVCPSPVAPSTAHRRADHGPTQASNWTTARSVMTTRRLAERLAVGVERDGGHRPPVRVDTDGDHGRPFVAGMVVRDGQPDFRSTHPSVEPRRGGCRPRSAGCQRTNPTGGKSTTSQSTGTLDATGCRPHVLTAIQQVRAPD